MSSKPPNLASHIRITSTGCETLRLWLQRARGSFSLPGRTFDGQMFRTVGDRSRDNRCVPHGLGCALVRASDPYLYL